MRIAFHAAFVTAGLLAAMAAADPACAHAQLRQADPAVGSTLHSAPTQVTLTFSEALEPRFSTIVVQNQIGAPVDRHDLHVAGDDAHHVAIGLVPLAAGTYSVVWHATSVDTHKTEGSFTFTIAP